MSDEGSSPSGRSSSQTSRTSGDSKRAKTVKGVPKRTGSKHSTTASPTPDPSLTSFPSFSPDQASSPPLINSKTAPTPPKPSRTVSQKVRDRKNTLAGLTSASPSLVQQTPLFNDSPRPSLDVPGSLHLANDDHIERLIARTGAVKLVRQYAQDLAQRDAEISRLRARADNRERELKRLLREADVPTADIEKRLLRVEQDENGKNAKGPASASSLDGMMNEAMSERLTMSPTQLRNEIGMPLPSSDMITAKAVPRKTSAGSGGVKSSTLSSQSVSRSNSMVSESSQDVDATLRPKMSSSNTNRLSGLQNVFSPPTQSSSYFIGGAKAMKKPKPSDSVSVRSNQSSKSFASWTQIFGGKTQTSRGRAASIDTGAESHQTEAESALAKLAKVRTNPSPAPSKSSVSGVAVVKSKARTSGRRTPTATKISTTTNHVRNDSNASQPLTVELDNVLEPEDLPPTMSTINKTGNGLPLTDRFGFIYDQRRRKRQSLPVLRTKGNRLSAAETIGTYGSYDSSTGKDPIERSSTPMSMDEDSQKKSWQDYLKPAVTTSVSRPTQLLSHTPSAGAIVTISIADAKGTMTPPRHREVSASKDGLLPIGTVTTEPQSSNVTATSTDFNHEDESDANIDSPSKLLLDQLNDLHDSLQAERRVKWNDFLRRVRAERSNSIDKTSNNAPEADQLHGELIGIATLGTSNKQKAKYTHFKSLVLGGIPVSLRPKIWGECSGATASRIPGYYQDLVSRSKEGIDIDADAATQISADVKRTLRENLYFSRGPGVARLEEVLRCYALHNPEIGYCQGMNLIAGSLILAVESAEDAFWLLVAVIDNILPSQYFSGSLLVARADQLVLREYVSQILPALSAKLDDLGVELEAVTFHWFLSLFAGVLTGGESLYRLWDIFFVLFSSESAPQFQQDLLGVDFSALKNLSSTSAPPTPVASTANDSDLDRKGEHQGTSSPFLFQVAIALLKLNESALLALSSPVEVYSFVNSSITNHAISIDSLVRASEALRTKIKRSEVLEKRKAAIKALGG